MQDEVTVALWPISLRSLSLGSTTLHHTLFDQLENRLDG